MISNIEEVIHTFEDRVNYIETYLNYLIDTCNSVNVKNSNVLKSNVFLMLYNISEFSVKNSIEQIHFTIQEKKLKFVDLNNKIQNTYLDYLIRKEGFKEVSATQKDKLISLYKNKLISENNVIEDFSFEDFLKYKKSLISGNIDHRAIINITSLYGVVGVNRNKEETNLLKIKKIRNDLAHGSMSYKECSRDLTVSDLAKITADIIDYYKDFFVIIEDYFKNNRYSKQGVLV